MSLKTNVISVPAGRCCAGLRVRSSRPTIGSSMQHHYGRINIIQRCHDMIMATALVCLSQPLISNVITNCPKYRRIQIDQVTWRNFLGPGSAIYFASANTPQLLQSKNTLPKARDMRKTDRHPGEHVSRFDRPN